MIPSAFLRLLISALAAWLCVLLAADGQAQTASRERHSLDGGWSFHLGDSPEAGSIFEYAEHERLDKVAPSSLGTEKALEARRFDPVAAQLGAQLAFVQPDFDDSEWTRVSVPHDWAVTLPVDPKGDPARGYRNMDTASGVGVGWYRKEFVLPDADANRALSLEFDGAFRDSIVWLNGRCLGRHVGGYGSFRFDINGTARPGQTNVLVVRVDATRKEGWWYEGAGIHRHVWLVRTGLVHVAPDGIYVTSRISGDKASVRVTTWLRNQMPTIQRVRVTTSVVDATGAIVASNVARRIDIPPQGVRRIIRTLEVKQPRLWSPTDPYLYGVVSSVDGLGTSFDSNTTPIGIRSVVFDPDQGLLVNNARVPLRGVLLFPDHAGVGVAHPDRLTRWRLERVQSMGVNAIRPAYGAASPTLLDLCDRMGLMVLGEHRRPGAGLTDLALLENMVRRDRNRPSIIAWCVGSDEFAVQGDETFAREVIAPMREAIRRIDSSRPVTMAMNWDWGRGVSNVLDVQGFSYRGNGIRGQRLADAGEVGGSLDIDAFHAAHAKKPGFGTAEGGELSTRGVYINDASRGYFSAYDRNLAPWGDFADLIHGNWASTAESWLRYYRERPWLAGAFLDAAFDRRGHPAPLAWPVTLAQSGVMDLCGYPKDSYYFYKSWWSGEPLVHLLPHWNWLGREGQPVEVWVHGNTEEVELLLNGRSLGRSVMPRGGHLEWSVPFEAGVLEARGFTSGRLAATSRRETTGSASRLVLTSDRTQLMADGRDIALITVAAQDDRGRVVPTAMNNIDFEITSAGRIIGTGNGNPADHERDAGMRRALFNGLAQVIVQSTDVPAPITLTARGTGLVPTTIVIDVVKPGAAGGVNTP